MIRHEQAQAGVPGELLVIVLHCRQHGSGSVRAAQLVFTRRHAFDSDKKPTALSDPLWNRVRKFFTHG